MMTKTEAQTLHDILALYEREHFALMPAVRRGLNIFILGKNKQNYMVCVAPAGMNEDQARRVSRWNVRGKCKVIHTTKDAINHITEISGEKAKLTQEEITALWPTDETRIDTIGQNGPTGEHYAAQE